jgi:hypothetical protein
MRDLPLAWLMRRMHLSALHFWVICYNDECHWSGLTLSIQMNNKMKRNLMLRTLVTALNCDWNKIKCWQHERQMEHKFCANIIIMNSVSRYWRAENNAMNSVGSPQVVSLSVLRARLSSNTPFTAIFSKSLLQLNITTNKWWRFRETDLY